MSDLVKITKAQAGYVYSPFSHYFCSECALLSHDGKCTNYTTADELVASTGGCNDWRDLARGRQEGQHDRTRAQTGYMENGVGFSCKRCEEFIGRAERCKKVDEAGDPAWGRIDPNGCCNFWERDPVDGNKPDAKFHEESRKLFTILPWH